MGIIGVVAAITMPTIISNVQKIVLKNQAKKVVSQFSQAVFKTQADLGYGVECSYWANGAPCKEKCVEKDPIYKNCISWKCEDGTPLSSDHNGPRNDCAPFQEQLFTKTLKVVKFCNGHALANGCINDTYHGTDKIKAEQNPDAEVPPNPNADFSDSNIKNIFPVWVLADGSIIIKYGEYKNTPAVFAIDINGHKGPNKWGYDLFVLKLMGTRDGITKLMNHDYVIEKGGISAGEIFR